MTVQPTVTALNGRSFACSPAAILVFVVNEREELLLLSSHGAEGWEVVNGGVEADETVLAAALRETREEAGALKLRPLGTVHVSTHHYDEQVDMISIAYLLAYEGGDVVPGDDMAGSQVCWASRDDIEQERVRVCIPALRWMCTRALDLYRLWKDEPPRELEIAVPS